MHWAIATAAIQAGNPASSQSYEEEAQQPTNARPGPRAGLAAPAQQQSADTGSMIVSEAQASSCQAEFPAMAPVNTGTANTKISTQPQAQPATDTTVPAGPSKDAGAHPKVIQLQPPHHAAPAQRSSESASTPQLEQPPLHVPSLPQQQAPDQHAQQQQQQQQMQELQHKVQVLTRQLAEATGSRRVVKGLEASPSAIASPRGLLGGPAHGSHASSVPQGPGAVEAWDRLQLRLQKAERALEHERAHSESLRQRVEQLEVQQQQAANHQAAAATITTLEAELRGARSLVEQRTREAAALQRAVVLGDETVTRLRAQLAGLLGANQEAVAREQEMEKQASELRVELAQRQRQLSEQHQQHMKQLAAQQEQHAQQLATQQEQHAAQLAAARDASSRGSSCQAAQQQEISSLRATIAQLESSLSQARAEVARKDAGIRALEAILSQHGRNPATAALPDPPSTGLPATMNSGLPQGGSLPATVTIDVFMGGPQGPAQGQAAGGTAGPVAQPGPQQQAQQQREPQPTLPGGLSEAQWKLVMLSEAVRGLRTTVMRLRQQRQQQQQQQQQQTAGAGVAGPAGGGTPLQPVVSAGSADGAGPQGEAGGGVVMEVVEVDLPEEEVTARVSQLAAQMLLLEEELQQLRSSSTCDTGAAGSAASKDAQAGQGAAQAGSQSGSSGGGTQQDPGVVVVHSVASPTALKPTVSGSRQAQPGDAAAPGGHSLPASGPGLVTSHRSRRRGWFSWLFRARDDGHELHEV